MERLTLIKGLFIQKYTNKNIDNFFINSRSDSLMMCIGQLWRRNKKLSISSRNVNTYINENFKNIHNRFGIFNLKWAIKNSDKLCENVCLIRQYFVKIIILILSVVMRFFEL
jgi:hypothetical protein